MAPRGIDACAEKPRRQDVRSVVFWEALKRNRKSNNNNNLRRKRLAGKCEPTRKRRTRKGTNRALSLPLPHEGCVIRTALSRSPPVRERKLRVLVASRGCVLPFTERKDALGNSRPGAPPHARLSPPRHRLRLAASALTA